MSKSNKYNNHKIAWFYEKLESLKNNKILAPIYVRIKPTNRCMHGCEWCVYKKNNTDMHESADRLSELPKEKLLETLDCLRDIGTKAVTFSGGGEPLIHPDIEEIMEKTIKNNIDLSIITNGQLLENNKAKILKNAKWVRISMDYYDEKSFEASRKKSFIFFNQITKNIKDFSSIKNDSCELCVNFIVTKKNYDKLCKISEILKSLNVDNVRFSPVWVDNFHKYHSEIEQEVKKQLEYARKNIQDESFTIYDSYKIDNITLKRHYCKCYFMQITPSIGADGNIYNCHNKSYDNDAIIGSILQKTFSEVWFSESAKKHFMNFNPSKSCNCQCANDYKNIFIDELIKAYGDNYV